MAIEYTKYSSYSKTFTPSGTTNKRTMRSYLYYKNSEDNNKYYVEMKGYVTISGGSCGTSTGKMTLSATGKSNVVGKGYFEYQGATTKCMASVTHTYSKTHNPQNITIKSKWVMPDSSKAKGTYEASATITIPAKASYPVTFNANEGGNPPSNQTKWYGEALVIANEVPTKEEYSFKWWNTELDGSGTNYVSGQSYTSNEPLTLYAQWQGLYPPTLEWSNLRDEGGFTSWTKNFSEVAVDVSNIYIREGRTLDSIELHLIPEESGAIIVSHEPTIPSDGAIRITPAYEGSQAVVLVIKDSEGLETLYNVAQIEVENPTWERTVHVTEKLIADINVFGNAEIECEAWNYVTGSWEHIGDSFTLNDGSELTDWSFNVTLTEQYVDVPTSTSPTSKVRFAYNHSDVKEKEYRTSFFKTTRNANFGTGLANTMFISGCEEPNYSSRVWWSYVNNPLYFPDTNYVEVGSNDTAVMGLCKVGDYLGVVKQSKTTDTAIFLLYPTTFDDDTTYAVKQGVQGVGALSKYTFNILGDETLFLSPNGVVAIAPSEDEEHKVLNRSFYIDGRLMNEPNLEEAYSFVHDGKYLLAINQNCYVLDGNQRNSWGNDKTNLVYECYYLDNIPAKCFMKHHNDLWFCDDIAIYRFKRDGELDCFIDGSSTDEEVLPVVAQWSTIFDDDGSLNYFKTTEKKGQVISLLPQGESTVEVYAKKDNDEEVLLGEVELNGDIPKEFYPNKKFKKYKRLQYILKCDSPNGGFGIDSIVKPYSLGNYSKNRR